jgi:GT2 family glycosyltransferase
MPTAVVELELKRRTGDLVVPGHYSRALVLLRWAGRPVGQVTVPVAEGRVHAQAIEQRLATWAGWEFWQAWLHDALHWDETGTGQAAAPPPCTVAVCTRERPNELARCLFALMALPDQGQEYLVVDNRPTSDATARVVASYPRVRYVCQDSGGLDAARNRALREARHDIVAFTDDDAFVDAGWLKALTRNFRDPLVQCVTGLTLPAELETDAQECFERYSPFGRGFARRVFDGGEMNPMAVGAVGAGANMAVRQAAVRDLGGFDEALDAGTPTRSGGDHEMFSRLLGAGYRIVYDPAALSWHLHRRSARELAATLRGYGTGVYAMWTRALLVGRELTVFKHALLWMRDGQIPAVVHALRPGRRVPLRLVLTEFAGCAAGPLAYLRSRRMLQQRQAAERGAGSTWRQRMPRRT